jgi:hypothetical protein
LAIVIVFILTSRAILALASPAVDIVRSPARRAAPAPAPTTRTVSAHDANIVAKNTSANVRTSHLAPFTTDRTPGGSLFSTLRTYTFPHTANPAVALSLAASTIDPPVAPTPPSPPLPRVFPRSFAFLRPSSSFSFASFVPRVASSPRVRVFVPSSSARVGGNSRASVRSSSPSVARAFVVSSSAPSRASSLDRRRR